MGINDVCLSLPTLVGRDGVHQVIEPQVSDGEREALLHSASALKEVWDKVAAAAPH